MPLYYALAIFHHLAVFGLAGLLAMEFALLTPGLPPAGVRRLARIDMLYGLCSGLVLLAGALRVFFGIKGAQYYLSNPVFWTKLGCFAGVGIMSIVPTLTFLKWRRAAARTGTVQLRAEDVARMRLWMAGEAAFLLGVIAAAAALGLGLGA